jgi:hypothetical protein
VITTLNNSNQSLYTARFNEAEDILMGFKKVYTYDAEEETYFFKNDNWGDDESLLYLDAGVTNAVNFIDKLREYGALYVLARNKETKEPIGKASGFDPKLRITTIEEYYHWIKNLGEIDRKYTALPLDEKPFVIDANTRGITIPENFKKNGLAVQGDHIAEVVYFKIDRYFDYIDFNNTEICIQWELPKNADGVVVKGISREYLRDIESDPGKLIFGWALSDIITANSGVIKFSVRFFELEDPNAENKKLEYNFSTLTASANIQSSLNFNLNEGGLVVDRAGDRILERLENSTVVGGYIAAEPVFEIDLSAIADLDADNGTYTLIVKANSSDAGDISYEWKRESLKAEKDEDGSIIPAGAITKLTYENDYQEVAYADMKVGNNYYYKNNNSNTYLNYMGSIPPAVGFNYKVYEKISTCTVNSAGKYWVEALNRVGSIMEDKSSVICVFPLPTPVKDIVNPKAQVILTLSELGEVMPQSITAGAGNTDGYLTYEWYYDSNADVNFGSTPPNWEQVFVTKTVETTDEEGNVISTEEVTVPATDATLAVRQTGRYRAKIINNRNKETKFEFTDPSRVTYSAQAPVITPLAEGEEKFNDAALTDLNCPKVVVEDVIPSDGYTIEWFKFNDGVEDYPLNLENKKAFIFNPAKLETYPDDIILGDYYAIVTNHLNGSSADARTEYYTII